MAGRLLADEAVIDQDFVIGEWFLVEEMAELAVEALVLVVSDLDQAVLDAERVAEVVAEFVLRDFRCPALEILAVEEHQPVFLREIRIGGRCLLREGGAGAER